MTAVIFENTTRAGSDFGVASAMTVILMLIVYVRSTSSLRKQE